MRAPYAYKRGPPKPRKKRDDAEHRFQVAVATYLRWALPKAYRFTASAAGVATSMSQASKMKAAGQERGWLDIMIKNKATGAVRWIELKVDGGALTPEQREFIEECPKVCAVARTLEEVERALIGFGITPLCAIEHANRYSAGRP